MALCREPTEPAGETGVGLIKLPTQAGETGVGFTQGDPPAQGLATRKRAGALFTALRAGMTMLLPSSLVGTLPVGAAAYRPAGACGRRPWLGSIAAAPLFKVVELRSTPRKLFEKWLLRPSEARPGPVSAPASGPAPRWGASRTDGRGNVDRFAAERHRRSLTPSRKANEI